MTPRGMHRQREEQAEKQKGDGKHLTKMPPREQLQKNVNIFGDSIKNSAYGMLGPKIAGSKTKL